MNNLTVADLRADYVAKALKRGIGRTRQESIEQRRAEIVTEAYINGLVRWADYADEESKKKPTWPHLEAARLYVIARDYGIRAATQFKITNGAVDPRPK